MFPFRNRAVARAEARKRVEAESRAQDIEHIMERWPESLSGGEQQLTQIARALVRSPRVLLMDEPLAKLDIRVRRRLRKELVELQRGYGVTMVYASNRPEEIMEMPDRLVALSGGRLVQTGTPAEVRSRPATMAIADLTGPMSRLRVTVEADTDGFWLVGDGVRVRAWPPKLAGLVGSEATLGCRPDDVRLSDHGPIAMTVGASTIIESRPATSMHSSAGVLHTFETSLVPDSRVTVGIDGWLLFDSAGSLVVSSPA